MTVKSSGAISISDLVAEFGGDSSPSITEYYRGGALVPSTRYVPAVTYYGEYSTEQFNDLGPSAANVQYKSSDSRYYFYWGGAYLGVTFVNNITTGGYQYQAVNVQYGLSGIIYFSIKRRTATYVPPSNVPINTGVPSSGAIQLTNFYGATAS